jgi:hypothetical protein
MEVASTLAMGKRLRLPTLSETKSEGHGVGAEYLVPLTVPYQNSGKPSIRINWDRAPSGYAENQHNWIFL